MQTEKDVLETVEVGNNKNRLSGKIGYCFPEVGTKQNDAKSGKNSEKYY